MAALPRPESPAACTLLASPNPFNPATEIAFSLVAPAEARLTVFNLRGEVVARLVDGALPAGEHRVNFDGAALASGVYLAMMEAGGRRVTIKLLLTR